MNEFMHPAPAHMADGDDQQIICHIMVDQIKVMADIGAHAHEHGRLQPLILHASLTIIPPAEDELDATFDYAKIKIFAEELAQQRTVLIESFAKRLAQKCLLDDKVITAEIRIEKPEALPNSMAGTRIKLSRRPKNFT